MVLGCYASITVIDGVVEEPFSPMRARWAEAEAAKAEAGEAQTLRDLTEAQ